MASTNWINGLLGQAVGISGLFEKFGGKSAEPIDALDDLVVKRDAVNRCKSAIKYNADTIERRRKEIADQEAILPQLELDYAVALERFKGGK